MKAAVEQMFFHMYQYMSLDSNQRRSTVAQIMWGVFQFDADVITVNLFTMNQIHLLILIDFKRKTSFSSFCWLFAGEI